MDTVIATMEPQDTHLGACLTNLKVPAHARHGDIDNGLRLDRRHRLAHYREQQQPAVALAVTGLQLWQGGSGPGRFNACWPTWAPESGTWLGPQLAARGPVVGLDVGDQDVD